jgi:hypothetical protein
MGSSHDPTQTQIYLQTMRMLSESGGTKKVNPAYISYQPDVLHIDA